MAVPNLSRQISEAERSVSTDSYDMSVGELINVYRDKEIRITPEYQRLFRWTIEQKSLFIESLLLGIPIPPIFVIETESRVWELIDGLQRTSTILQFVNELREPDTGALIAPVPLVSGRHLPALAGAVWDDESANGLPISSSEKIRLKRAKISIQILRRTSDETSKYDLFQRLNSGGTKANRQELRNCMIVMQEPAFLSRTREMAEGQEFQKLFKFTRNQLNEQTHIEYINRSVVLLTENIAGSQDVEDFFDDETLKILTKRKDVWESSLDKLQRTFLLIDASAGERALYKPGKEGQKSKPPQNTALEVIVTGIARNLDAIEALESPTDFIKERIDSVWEQNVMARASSSGVSGTTRLRLTIPFGEAWFKP